MPYLVLAIGLLMSATGLSAVWFGYPIIQVERGWASVIAGATLLTGGLMTVALGLMFRTLVELKSTLLREARSSSRDTVDGELGEVPILTPALVPVAPTLGGILAPEPPHTPTFHDVEEPATLSREDERSLASLLEPEARRPAAIDEHALYAAAIEDDLPPSHHHSEPAHANQDTPVVEPEIHVPAPVEAAPPTAHEPAPPDSKPSPVPPDGDWLDRAFSDLDHELGTPHRDTVPPPRQEPIIAPPTVPVPSMAEPVAELAATPAHDPHADVALAELPAATSDVIGRYEADGTFYTMYADGSIEAQSDAGLYRFASMAELRAFIEG